MSTRHRIISPSILSADFLHLGKDVEMVNNSRAEWIHLDIMDGRFVPNISFGLPVVKAVSSISKKVCDVHLMIEHPEQYIHAFRAAGAEVLSIHYEACRHLHRAMQEIKSEGMRAGVVLNPHTPVSLLEDLLPELDLVLLMSVNPGFGGQTFIRQTLHKVRALRTMIDNGGYQCLIEVDGGVNDQTGKELFDTGADVLVAGSYVFGSDDPTETISNLLDI